MGEKPHNGECMEKFPGRGEQPHETFAAYQKWRIGPVDHVAQRETDFVV